MASILKDENRLGLYVVVAANLALFVATARSGALFGGNLLSMSRSWPELLPAGLGLILVGVINAQVDGTTKAKLVFWRWSNPLPACEAFSRLGPADPRVDMAVLAQKFSPLPVDARDQNSLWFRLYKSIEDQPAVRHAHREYLFTRDYHFLSALILVGLGAFAVITFANLTTALFYVAILLIQFFMTGQAARNHGRRLVCTVLATVGAKGV